MHLIYIYLVLHCIEGGKRGGVRTSAGQVEHDRDHDIAVIESSSLPEVSQGNADCWSSLISGVGFLQFAVRRQGGPGCLKKCGRPLTHSLLHSVEVIFCNERELFW